LFTPGWRLYIAIFFIAPWTIFSKIRDLKSGGILNLSPKASLDSFAHKGAIRIDVREEYMNRFKLLDVPETFIAPIHILEETYPPPSIGEIP